MLDNIKCLGHSTIRINKDGKVVYIDPYNLNEESHDADIIFVTHSHYDHYSLEDINKVRKEDTKLIITNDLIDKEDGICVVPNQSYEVDGIKFNTVNSYNVNKQFHPKGNEWVGYIIEIDEERYYIAGDTDITPENKQVKCDVAFIPVGGTYTMNYEEAAELTNIIKPKIAIPTHYGSIVGEKEDGLKFKALLNSEIECKILIK